MLDVRELSRPSGSSSRRPAARGSRGCRTRWRYLRRSGRRCAMRRDPGTDGVDEVVHSPSLLNLEREQHVAGSAEVIAVAGVEIQHAAGDRRARALDRAAARALTPFSVSNSRLVSNSQITEPSVVECARSAAVVRAREQHAGNQRRRRDQRGVAAGCRGAHLSGGGGDVPRALAGRETRRRAARPASACGCRTPGSRAARRRPRRPTGCRPRSIPRRRDTARAARPACPGSSA